MSSIYLSVQTSIGHNVKTEVEECCELAHLTGVDVRVSLNGKIFMISKHDEPEAVYDDYLRQMRDEEYYRRESC